jgi:hypothetical protein
VLLFEIEKDTQKISECFDRALCRFGSTFSDVVYWNFEQSTKLARSGIFRRPDLFSKTLDDVFRGGSTLIEKAIVSELKTTFQLSNRKYSGIVDALSEMKRMSS